MTSRGLHAQQPLLSMQYCCFLFLKSFPLFQWALGKELFYIRRENLELLFTELQFLAAFLCRTNRTSGLWFRQASPLKFSFWTLYYLASSGCPTSFVVGWTCNVWTKLAPSCLHFATCFPVWWHFLSNGLDFCHILGIARENQSAVIDGGWCIMIVSSV